MLREFIFRLIQHTSNETRKPLYLLWNNLDFEEIDGKPNDNPFAYSFICSPDPIFETDKELSLATESETQQQFNPQNNSGLIEKTGIALPNWHLHTEMPTLETWLTKDGFGYILLDQIPQAAVIANAKGLLHLEQIVSVMHDVMQIDTTPHSRDLDIRVTEMLDDAQKPQSMNTLHLTNHHDPK